MEATALKMGHEYMKLLPEIAPLLHELMEGKLLQLRTELTSINLISRSISDINIT